MPAHKYSPICITGKHYAKWFNIFSLPGGKNLERTTDIYKEYRACQGLNVD